VLRHLAWVVNLAAAAIVAVTTAAASAAQAPAGDVVFPSAIDPRYARESPGKARLLTCVDQYSANRATGGNRDLKWTQQQGGYYEECNKRLKGLD
jgi:hypothetical protein